MKIEYTTETTWTDELGTHRESVKKPGTFKKDLARIGKAIGQIAVFLFALAVAVAAVAIVYLALGWLLSLSLAFVTGGVLVLGVMRSVVALLILTFVASLFRA